MRFYAFYTLYFAEIALPDEREIDSWHDEMGGGDPTTSSQSLDGYVYLGLVNEAMHV